MYLVTADEMQAMDRKTISEFGIPGLVLMENAGRGAVDMLLRTYPHIDGRKKVLILAGRGNNGGDGFVIARYLVERRIPTTVLLLADREKVEGDARVNMKLFEKLIPHTPWASLLQIPDLTAFQNMRPELSSCDLIVDGILGTGLKSDVRGFFKDIIEAVNDSGKPVFSIDIPSGLNSDTGRPCGTAIKADATVTFAFAKVGHMIHPGHALSGSLEIVDIGIPNFISEKENPTHHLITGHSMEKLFPPRTPESHKGTYGHLLVVAGSPGKTGAAALTSNAAVACGTGLVTLAVPESLNPVLEARIIEPMTAPLPETAPGYLGLSALEAIKTLAGERKAIALGPGTGTLPDTRRLIREIILASRIPLVLDADGLNCIAGDADLLKKRSCPVIMTPHPGEMARLSGLSTAQIQTGRINAARSFAMEFNVILVLKGNRSLVAMPDGNVHICPSGNPGMASGGMGDVLTGFIAGFCAQGLTPENAAIAGVYLHGMCGDFLAENRGPAGYTASEMITAMPGILREVME